MVPMTSVCGRTDPRLSCVIPSPTLAHELSISRENRFVFSRERALRNKEHRKMVGEGEVQLHRCRLLPAAERLLQVTNHCERDVLAPGTSGNLDVERKSFRRGADPHGRAGPSRQVVHLRIAEAEIVRLTASVGRFALTKGLVNRLLNPEGLYDTAPVERPEGPVIWILPICGPKWPRKLSPAQGLPLGNSPSN